MNLSDGRNGMEDDSMDTANLRMFWIQWKAQTDVFGKQIALKIYCQGGDSDETLCGTGHRDGVTRPEHSGIYLREFQFSIDDTEAIE